MRFSTFNSNNYYNFFMEKRKPGRNNDVITVASDELAVIKSAAWAWYERGSGTEGRLIRESDVGRTQIDPKPSRYKLEAMRNYVQKNYNPPSTTSSSSPKSSTSRASISLLDRYEIERISNQLDYYMEASHAKYHGGHWDSGGKRMVAAALVEEPTAREVITYKSGAKHKLLSKGFWLKNALMCGSSRNDVVRSATINFEDYSRRRKGGRVAVVVVEGVGCRPRPRIPV